MRAILPATDPGWSRSRIKRCRCCEGQTWCRPTLAHTIPLPSMPPWPRHRGAYPSECRSRRIWEMPTCCQQAGPSISVDRRRKHIGDGERCATRYRRMLERADAEVRDADLRRRGPLLSATSWRKNEQPALTCHGATRDCGRGNRGRGDPQDCRALHVDE